MLDSFDPQTGILTHHCDNPQCQYHNCKNWEGFRSCIHHDETVYILVAGLDLQKTLIQNGMDPAQAATIGDVLLPRSSTDGRVDGLTHQHHFSHQEIQWTGADVIALPACECGRRMFIKAAFTEQELNAPNITIPIKHPILPGAVIGFTQHPAVQRHQQLAQALTASGKVYVEPGSMQPPAHQPVQQPPTQVPAQPAPHQQPILPSTQPPLEFPKFS